MGNQNEEKENVCENVKCPLSLLQMVYKMKHVSEILQSLWYVIAILTLSN
jgi:hypothetical protein